jgi:hypothetical protein
MTYVGGSGSAGLAARFNGVSSDIQVFGMPIPSNNAFSWSVWLRADALTPDGIPILEFCRGLGINEMSPALFLLPNASIQVYSYAYGYFGLNSPAGTVQTNTWLHIACTSATNAQRKIYVNGTVVATADGQPFGQEHSFLLIGRDRMDLLPRFRGYMDDLRIWTRTITASEVASLFAQGDCNSDGIPDIGQILSGQYADANGDGRPDICDCVAPIIVSQPVAVEKCAAEPLSLVVSAMGTSPRFQWRKDGVAITGATSAVFSIAAADPSDSGVYDCVVTNDCGGVTSESAHILVRAPQLLAQPTAQTVNVDQPVVFAAEMNLQSPCFEQLIYRWQRRNPAVDDDAAPDAWLNLNDGGGYAGSQSANLVIFRPTPGLATGYRCKITNACGCEADANGVIYTNVVNFSAACPSDFNNDGSVDGDDVITFFERWDGGC